MQLEEFVSRLQGVHPRGTGRWSARCPAHEDRSPSLSIKEGADGRILLHDFGGCTPREIVAALGLTLADLFNDSPLPKGQRPAPQPPKLDRVTFAWRYDLAGFDLRLRAERIIEAGTSLPIAAMTDDHLDTALRHVSRAYADRERAELFEHVADTLRERDFNERTARERQTRVA